MEAARHLVRIIVELTASVQNGHDDFCGRDALFVLFCRYTSTIVTNTHGLIGVNNDVDLAAVPSQRFVDRVINDLEHHMMKARTVIGIPDIHTWTLSDSIQAL